MNRMLIKVNPSGFGGTYSDVSDWTREHWKELERAIKLAVKSAGFEGEVRVM